MLALAPVMISLAEKPNILLIMIDDMGGFPTLAATTRRFAPRISTHSPHRELNSSKELLALLPFAGRSHNRSLCPRSAARLNDGAGRKLSRLPRHPEPRVSDHRRTFEGCGIFRAHGRKMASDFQVGRRRDPVQRRGTTHIPIAELPKNFYLTESLVDEMEQLIFSHDPAKPMFLYYAPYTPHSPIESTEERVARTRDRYRRNYEEQRGISSPLILFYPRQIEPREGFIQTPAHITDIAATCLAAAGFDYPAAWGLHPLKPLEGRSLLSLAQHPE